MRVVLTRRPDRSFQQSLAAARSRCQTLRTGRFARSACDDALLPCRHDRIVRNGQTPALCIQRGSREVDRRQRQQRAVLAVYAVDQQGVPRCGKQCLLGLHKDKTAVLNRRDTHTRGATRPNQADVRRVQIGHTGVLRELHRQAAVRRDFHRALHRQRTSNATSGGFRLGTRRLERT
ncbi:hypothetical protein [Lysobacter gummosus]|uniref:hypothetical protein n=1 Tax=Lysobacter gummosus TaxID=262324 RepID=UPI00362F5520